VTLDPEVQVNLGLPSEGGWLLGLSVVLITVAVWLVRRRAA
jgi:hypothetical protein